MSITRLRSTGRMSQAVSWPPSGRMIALAGQAAGNRDLDLAGQTADAPARIDALLAEAGAGREQIVQATIRLADIDGFDAMNAVWDAWCAPERAPARACVEAKLADPRLLVEIQVSAVV